MRRILICWLLSTIFVLQWLAIASPAIAGFPGNNGRILFWVDGSLATMNPDGSDVELLKVAASEAKYSPDGTKIVFDRPVVNGGWAPADQIFTMRADGTDIQQLTGDASESIEPAWSPDGGKIVFTRSESIWVMNADGTNRRRVTLPTETGFKPFWSPDGTTIAFLRLTGPLTTNIFTMAADGTGITQITDLPMGAWTYYADWSPDGKWIVFEGGIPNDPTIAGGETVDIFRVRADGSQLRNLTNSEAADFAPVWSPDGRSIVFNSRDAIYRIRPDGSGERKMAPMTGWLLDWQPVVPSTGRELRSRTTVASYSSPSICTPVSCTCKTAGESCAIFVTKPTEARVSIKIFDASGVAVPAVIGVDEDGDGSYHSVARICGSTKEPVPIAPGSEVLVWIKDVRAECPGAATAGTISATFS